MFYPHTVSLNPQIPAFSKQITLFLFSTSDCGTNLQMKVLNYFNNQILRNEGVE